MDPSRRVNFTLRLREAAFCDAMGSDLCASVSKLVEDILVVGEGLINGIYCLA